MKAWILTIFIFMMIPFSASASLSIEEIMYDYEGSDEKHEWVEVYNGGSESVDAASWHFFENEIHHGLVPDGFSIIAPGERALIVQDISTIRALYGNSIRLIKSSFSLNNTGETLSMSDTEKIIQSTVTYSSEYGAAGNGNSLQWNGSDWIEALPTPGAENVEVGQNPSPQPPSPTPSSGSSPTQSSISESVEYYMGHIIAEEQRFARSPISLEVYATHTKEGKTTRKIRGIHRVNFGDGSAIESSERIETEHMYQYPGSYTITFEYYRSPLAEELEQEPDVFFQTTLNVHAPNVEITDRDIRGGISLYNGTPSNLNIEGWEIFLDGDVYTFPHHSYIQSGKSISIPMEVHQLEQVLIQEKLNLRNDQGITLHTYDSKETEISPTNVIRAESMGDQGNSIPHELNTSHSHIDEFLLQHPDKEFVVFNDTLDGFNTQNKATEEGPSSIPLSILIGLGIVAGVLVFVKVLSLERRAHKESEAPEIQGDIELIK